MSQNYIAYSGFLKPTEHPAHFDYLARNMKRSGRWHEVESIEMKHANVCTVFVQITYIATVKSSVVRNCFSRSIQV